MVKKIVGKTPIPDKIDGQFCTNVAAKCVSILTLIEAYDIAVPVIVKLLLVIGAVAFGGKAIYHAKKVER